MSATPAEAGRDRESGHGLAVGVASAAMVMLLASAAAAQVTAPSGFSVAAGLSFRSNEAAVPVQSVGFAMHLGLARKLSERVAARAELGVTVFNFATNDGMTAAATCVAGPGPCNDTQAVGPIGIGTAGATIWMRPPGATRLYLLAGGGVYMPTHRDLRYIATDGVTTTSRTRLGLSGGMGYALTPKSRLQLNVEARYHYLGGGVSGLGSMTPLTLSLQF